MTRNNDSHVHYLTPAESHPCNCGLKLGHLGLIEENKQNFKVSTFR